MADYIECVKILWDATDSQVNKNKFVDECVYRTKFGPDVDKQLDFVENCIVSQERPNPFLYTAYLHMCHITKNTNRVGDFVNRRYYPYLKNMAKTLRGNVHLEYFVDLQFRSIKAKCGPIPEEVDSIHAMGLRIGYHLINILAKNPGCSCDWHKQFDHEMYEKILKSERFSCQIKREEILNLTILEVYDHLFRSGHKTKSAR